MKIYGIEYISDDKTYCSCFNCRKTVNTADCVIVLKYWDKYNVIKTYYYCSEECRISDIL